nr:putative UDP-glucuronosyl/UDP-glucosyltransferase [Tanacetum cinerariifolium]
MALEGKVATEAADYIICNSTIELEPRAFALFLKILPIGPLLATNREIRQAGHFWNEDSTCITLLKELSRSTTWYKWQYLVCLPKRLHGEIRHPWENSQLGTSTRSLKPSFSGLLHESLRLELYHGRKSTMEKHFPDNMSLGNVLTMSTKVNLGNTFPNDMSSANSVTAVAQQPTQK